MANGKNRLFWLTSLAIASIPLAVTFFGIYSNRNWLTIISFVVFLACLLVSTCFFISYKTFKKAIPLVLYLLRATSWVLSPLAAALRSIPVLGKVVNGSIRLIFWTWFIILMSSDVLVRKLLKAFVGLHEPSAGQYSTVNACDTNFQPCGEFGKTLDKEKVRRIEEGGQNFERDHDYDERTVVAKPRTNTRRSGPRPKSMAMDFKYRMPGKEGSDLTTMTSDDWSKVLEMAEIDRSRYDSDPGKRRSLDETTRRSTDEARQESKAADRPRYSQPIATTLAMVSKLVYEDVPIIRHELARSGYDMHSFRAIAYKNTCGFIVQKGRNIVLVFRGTDPLNLQNAWTDIQSRLVPVKTLQEPSVPLGKCHQGMWNALGKADGFLLPSEELAQQQREQSRLVHQRQGEIDFDEDGYPMLEESLPAYTDKTSPASSFRSEVTQASTLNLELSNQSIYQTVVTSIRAAYILIRFLVVGLFTHVSDPVDYRFAGEIRDLSAFAQACRWVDGLRLEHAEREYRRIERSSGGYRLGGAQQAGSRIMTRSNSLGGLYSQDELEYLDNMSSSRKQRRPSLTSQGSFKGSSRRLSLTGVHHVGHASSGNYRRRLSGHGSDRDSVQTVTSWKDLGNNILDIYNNQHRSDPEGQKRKKLRFYICGHSLGGGLATIFLAKMVQCNSPLLDIFSGLYTYGQPRIGDKAFSHAFGPKLACKMFHHVHNNDIFARVPFWGAYETPPGTLVFIDSSRKLTLYPPDPVSLMPIPVRGISFMHLSGTLNVRVIMRMRRESWLRIFERIVLPFFLNDHFPGDYVKALAEGKIEIVVQDSARYGGVDEGETGSPAQTGYFSYFARKKKPSSVALPVNIDIARREAQQNQNAKDLQTKKERDPKKQHNNHYHNNNHVLSSGENDSGYGAGNGSDPSAEPRARRRIVKYTYRQENEEDDDDSRYYSTYRSDRDHLRGDGEGETRWRELAAEPSRQGRRPAVRRSRSSSLSRSTRSFLRMQKANVHRRSISRQRSEEIEALGIHP
ncbi:hypothetical protein CPC16_006018 [Podila verticillata]|nr:hypothetical protein CPC16_006018 [Podila verticillata]KAI9236698.1 MAG: hypothetical protein BYD32DRAFT_12861 [Podila humilis]